MRERVSVVLYTRPGCHLCEEARSQMLAANCADLFRLEEINIDSDSVLAERYGNSIPVIAVNGLDVFKYRVRPAEFRELVEKASKDRVAD